MLVIGIDPGKKGCITTIESKGGLKEVSFLNMPLLKNKEIDSLKIYKSIKELIKLQNENSYFCYIEKAQVLPKQGSVSGMTIGRGYGKIISILEILKIPFKEIRPVEWKNEFGLNIKKKKEKKVKKKEKKELTAKRACELFPPLKSHFYTKRKALIDGRTDSLLIAEFCLRKMFPNQKAIVIKKKRTRR